jgi:flavin-dependent dehydrogenase
MGEFDNTAKKWDITIIGGGVAGCATAIAIKNITPDLTVQIIDRSDPTAGSFYEHSIRPRIGETLPPQIMIPLQRLGLLTQFRAAGFVRAQGTEALWGEDQPYANEYIFSAYGNGWHVDRRQFDELLQREAQRRGVSFVRQSGFRCIEPDENGWQLSLLNSADGAAQKIRTGFVVDATGRAAKVARALGVAVQQHDNLAGIYRFYSIEEDLDKPDYSTLIESASNGWWYSARLPQGQRVVALMTDHDLIKNQSLSAVAMFEQALQATRFISDKLKRETRSKPGRKPVVTAAHSQSLKRVADQGWLAVGDAAYTFDPLSSLGIFKALRMAILASYAVHDHFHNKQQGVEKYQKLAQAELENYAAKHQQYYAEEQRFADYPFWSRRHAA